MRTWRSFAYSLQRRLWRVLRPRTRGVKVMLFTEAGEVLLIRNSYGRSDLHVLPGGGVRPFESPEHAAVREVKEELDCGVEAMTFVSRHHSTSEGKRDTVFVYQARIVGKVRIDETEVAQASFHRTDALPSTVSPATRRRIDEHRGLREASDIW